MTTITTRSGKGSPLTNNEVDANFTNLNDDKVEASGDSITGNLSFGDNNKAIFGAGSDLQIYHSGLHSFITDSGTGDLLIGASSNIALMNAAFSENKLLATTDGALKLYYDGNQRLATTSTGVDMTGNVLASDSFEIDSGSSGFLVGGGQTGTTAIGKLHNSSGVLTLDTDGSRSIQFSTGGSAMMRVDGAGNGVIINEDSNDQDFRVESDNNTHALFVDAGNDVVNFGTSNHTLFNNSSDLYGASIGSSGLLQMSRNSGTMLFLNRQNANGEMIDLRVNGAQIGSIGSSSESLFIKSTFEDRDIIFKGNDGGTEINALTLDMSAAGAATFNSSVTATQGIFTQTGGDFAGVFTTPFDFVAKFESTDSAAFIILEDNNSTNNANRIGAVGDSIQIESGNVENALFTSTVSVFNENSVDMDFRVESNSNTHMIFVDGGNDHVNIGTSTDLTGVFNVDGNVGLSGAGTGSRYIALLAETNTYAGRLVLQAGGGSAAYGGSIVMYGHSHASNGGDVVLGISAGSGGQFRVHNNGVDTGADRLTIGENGDFVTFPAANNAAVFNQSGVDADFRVESNNDANAFVVNGGTDNIGMGTASPTFSAGGGLRIERASTATLRLQDTGSHGFEIRAEANAAQFYSANNRPYHFLDASSNQLFAIDNSGNGTFTNYGAGQGAGPYLNLYRNSASPADGDDIGIIQFQGEDSVGSLTTYASVSASIHDVSNGTEDGRFNLNTTVAGSSVSRMYMLPTSTTFNEGSGDIDFRVESDSNTHMLFVDASQNAVGINDSAPSGVRLTVLGVDTAAVAWGDTSKRGFLSFDGSGNPIVRAGSGLGLKIQSNSTRDVATFGTSETVFNEPGNNQDFRVESDSSTNMFVVDAAENKVGINRSPNISNSKLEVGGADNVPIFNVEASGHTGGLGIGAAGLQLFHGSSSKVLIASGGMVINEDSADFDFRVESNNNANMLFVDAGNDTVLINTSTPADSSSFSVFSTGTAASFRTSPTTAVNLITFRNGNGLVGSISTSGSATAFNTSSDQRLKKNIADADDAGELIDAIQVRSFDWIADGEHQRYGMVAQELNTVAPEAVSEGETKDDMMGVDYSKLVPMLVKEIQSLRARVAQLESN